MQRLEKELATSTTRFFKDELGKGPLRITVKLSGEFMIARVYGVLAAAELKLCRTREGAIEVKSYKAGLLKFVSASLKEEVYKITGLEVKRFFCDLDPAVNEGIIIMVFNDQIVIK